MPVLRSVERGDRLRFSAFGRHAEQTLRGTEQDGPLAVPGAAGETGGVGRSPGAARPRPPPASTLCRPRSQSSGCRRTRMVARRLRFPAAAEASRRRSDERNRSHGSPGDGRPGHKRDRASVGRDREIRRIENRGTRDALKSLRGSSSCLLVLPPLSPRRSVESARGSGAPAAHPSHEDRETPASPSPRPAAPTAASRPR